MKKISHSKLPITLECTDTLDINMLDAIHQQMTKPPFTDKPRASTYGWELWIDEYGNWFEPNKPNPKQLEIEFPELKHFADDFHEGK